MDNPLKRWLKTRNIGQEVIILEEIDSTNSYAKQILPNSPKNGTVIIAKKQISGRGQKDHTWCSPEGGLYYSCIINTKPDVRVTLITLACGLAVSDTVDEIASIKSSVKWVNDVLVKGKKIAGILLESRLRADSITLIIGIGLNVNSTSDNFPDELQGISTSLKDEAFKEFNVDQVAAVLSNNIEKYLEMFYAGNFKLLKSIWLQKSDTFGKTITFSKEGKEFEGVVIDINDTGELLVQTYMGKVFSLSSNLSIVYKEK